MFTLYWEYLGGEYARGGFKDVSDAIDYLVKKLPLDYIYKAWITNDDDFRYDIF